MKKYIVVLCLLIFMQCNTPPSDKEEITYEYSSANFTDAHLSANTFEATVAQTLKERYAASYPRKVSDVSVSMAIYDGRLHLIWTAYLVRCQKADADTVFSRRGKLLPGASAFDVQHHVEKVLEEENEIQPWIQAFRQRYMHRSGNPCRFDRTSTGMQNDSTYWCIREFFCVGP
ncbi:hypothetical protein IT401_01490 [Candidatus Nomurabacteria bacterium]|nr:hypothetical protein [Candidatus Nomurabacteria bacterium]